MSSIKEFTDKYVADTYGRFNVEIVEGRGSLFTDVNGREYIDMGTGIGVNAFGSGDEIWKKAVIEQLNRIQHTSNLYYTKPCGELAKILCEKTGMSRVFFANSGAEANECAIKVARKYAAAKHGDDCYKIITLKNSFHGRTITTLSATGQDHYHEEFLPMTEGFLYSEPGDFSSLETLVNENKIAAVMIECIQGEGGVNVLDKEFVRKINELCHKKDILLIVDEVQTGNGRTGKLYSYMNYNIAPDLVTTAKGLGGGLPIGACILGERTADVLKPGDHGSTFGGNPVVCAGAISIINRIDDAFLKEVNKKSRFIFNSLEGAEGVESVSGMGLMVGIKTKKNAGDVVKECMENGVLVLTAKRKVRLLPALNIPMEVLEKAIEVIKESCK